MKGGLSENLPNGACTIPLRGEGWGTNGNTILIAAAVVLSTRAQVTVVHGLDDGRYLSTAPSRKKLR
jgi:hypothetical protein